eukprot:scaffold94414_cov69-Phaeocystis_antarctica.AAC.1
MSRHHAVWSGAIATAVLLIVHRQVIIAVLLTAHRIAVAALCRKGNHVDWSRQELRGTTDRAELVAIVACAARVEAFAVASVAFVVA